MRDCTDFLDMLFTERDPAPLKVFLGSDCCSILLSCKALKGQLRGPVTYVFFEGGLAELLAGPFTGLLHQDLASCFPATDRSCSTQSRI